MRHVALFSSAIFVFLGGCVLVGTYNYDDYKDKPAGAGGNDSVSSSTGGGGVAGVGGMGGGIMCPPELCDDGFFDPCRMSDCSVLAQKSIIFGSIEHQAIKAMVAPSNGDIVIGGNYAGSISFGNGKSIGPSPNAIRPFVAKLNSNGVGLAAFDRPESGSTYSVDMNPNGTDFYGAGVIFDPMISSHLSVFVQKFGNAPWNHLIGNDAANGAAGVAYGGPGQVFAAGHYQGLVSITNCPQWGPYNAATVDSLLIQFADADGSCTWFSPITNSYATSIDATPGRVAVGGFYSGTIGLPGAINTSDTASFVAVYDTSMMHALVSKIFLVPESGGTINLVNVTFDPMDQQSIYVTAKFRGSITIDGNKLISTTVGTDSDMLVAKFDSIGKLVWITRFGGIGEQVPYSITPFNADIIISGTTAKDMALGGDLSVGPLCSASKCMFVLKLSGSTGTSIWGRAFGANEGASDATAVSAASETNFWLGGGWSSMINFGGQDLVPMTGGQDLVLAKFTPVPL